MITTTDTQPPAIIALTSALVLSIIDLIALLDALAAFFALLADCFAVSLAIWDDLLMAFAVFFADWLLAFMIGCFDLTADTVSFVLILLVPRTLFWVFFGVFFDTISSVLTVSSGALGVYLSGLFPLLLSFLVFLFARTSLTDCSSFFVFLTVSFTLFLPCLLKRYIASSEMLLALFWTLSIA